MQMVCLKKPNLSLPNFVGEFAMYDALPMREHKENDDSKALDRSVDDDVFQDDSQNALEKVLHEVAEEANIGCSNQATF